MLAKEDLRAELVARLEVDPQDTVALTIDMQRDYLDPEVATKPVPAAEADAVVGQTARLLSHLRACGVPIIHVYTTRRWAEVRRGFDANPYGHALRMANEPRSESGAAGMPDRMEGSEQSEVPSALDHEGDIHIPSKKSMDGFLGTELDLVLRRAFDAKALVITGINTDTCVLATTFSAANRGYRPVVVSDCVASRRGGERHRMALELMADSIAWVMTAAELEVKLPSPTDRPAKAD